jgi:hypothetical protein
MKWTHKHSLNLAAPIMEESLLHLVNLSIESQEATTYPTLSLKEGEDQGRELQASVPSSRGGEDGGVYFMRADTRAPNHHGSLANHSTATALIQLTDMWMEASEKKELTGVCMIDQSAVYDSH